MQGISDLLQNLIIIFVILDAMLIASAIYAFIQAHKYRPVLDIKPRPLNKSETASIRRALTNSRWNTIMKRHQQGTADSMKVAIIEADKMIDDLLKNAGFKGEHMADRLDKLATANLPNLPKLWRAHRLRNEVVHSPDFQLTQSLASRTMEDYAAFLRDLNLID